MEQKINEMLSDLVVFYHKLQCYHWYVKGPNFFMVHKMLEQSYDEIKEFIDIVAEASLMMDIKPVATLSDFSKTASIKEAKASYIEPKDLFKDILADYQHLYDSAIAMKKDAEENDYDLLSVTLDDIILVFSKKIWMLSQSLM